VSKFVKECRREWKRLRVPDSVANEMAADLTADLDEAEAEGASIEDVLGSSAFDPRSFAASWAAERGVSQTPTAPAASSQRWLPLAALAAIAVALVGALMVIAPKPRFGRSSGSGLAVVPHPSFRGPPPGLATHASTVADHLHALGVLVLIVGIVATIATLVWIWRTRAGGGSGWSSPSAAWPRP
jgi:hypothetical protein